MLEDAASNWFGLQGFEYLDLARIWQVLLSLGLVIVVLPRADVKLALATVRKADRPLGRGVWVLDSSDTNNFAPRPTIRLVRPGPADEFVTRAFGPFLVIRTRAPTRTPAGYFLQARRTPLVGKALFLGDADVNYQTVVRARALRVYTPALALDQLPVAGRILERGEARRATRAAAPVRPQPAGGGDRGRGADDAADQEGAERRAAVLVAVHGRIVGAARCVGDLLLDVIVRLEQPVASGLARMRRGDARRPGRAGGERGSVGGGARRRGRASSPSAAATAPDARR